MGSWIADFAYGWRALARRGPFTAVAILILTIGIGATTAVFSFVNAILVRPLPYQDPDGLTFVWTTTERNPRGTSAWSDVETWRQRAGTFERVAALDIGELTLAAPAPTAPMPERAIAGRVSADFFPMLGVAPLVGRWPRGMATASDREEIVLSHALWLRRFAAAPDVVGRQIALDDRLVTIVGVMPRSFWFLSREFDIWTPLLPSPQQRADRAARPFFVAARLRPGVDLARAQTEISAVTTRAQEAAHDGQPRPGLLLTPLGDELRQPARPLLIALAGAVLCLLLLACANLAHLLIARGIERRRELAIRLALGAGRARVVRLLLAESLILAIVSGTLGVLLAALCLPLFTRLLPVNLPMPIPGADLVRIDRTVLLFAMIATLGTTVLFSGWPLLHGARTPASDALKATGSTLDGGVKRGGRMLLIGAEVAFAVLLLVAGSLMVRSLIAVERAPLGFDPAGVLTLNVPDARVGGEANDAAARRQTLDRIHQRLAALPGVQAIGLTDTLPLSGVSGRVALTDLSGAAPPSSSSPQDAQPTAIRRIADAGYFTAMGITLRRGRSFAREDVGNSAPVALISESMARLHWGATDPIGRTFSTSEGGPPLRVIGIVNDVRHWMGREPAPTFYRAYEQWPTRTLSFVLRTQGGAAALGPAVQGAIWDVAPAQPLRYVGVFDGDIGDQLWTQRLGSRVLALFAGIALLLTATGVFGVMAALVSQRTREIGIRAALGASPRAIVHLVMHDTLRPIALGIGAGLGGAWLLTRSLGSVLHGVTAADPMTFASVALVMSLVAAAACYLPARRASRLAPVETLQFRG